MKKTLIWFTLIMVLIVFGSASAATKSTRSSSGYGGGKWALGGYVGYAFGFGDAFQDFEVGYRDPYTGEFVGISWENKLTFNLGAKVKYRYSPKLSFVGDLDYQAGDVDFKAGAGGYHYGVSDSYDFTAILADAVYTLSPEKVTTPYLNGGLGIYMDGDTNLGMNFGGGIEHFFQDNLALDVAAMFHIIFTSGQSTTYIQIKGGLNYYFGK
jgi:opacity protein-like surface antigen